MAGSLRVELKIDASGPLADGGAQHLVDDWVQSTTQVLADTGLEMLRAFPMDRSGRSTGEFRRSLATVRRSPAQVDVPGPMIKGKVWAPWLEGTSSRNQSTKFKGYHLFRKTRLALQQRAPQIGQAELDRLLPRIGGG